MVSKQGDMNIIKLEDLDNYLGLEPVQHHESQSAPLKQDEKNSWDYTLNANNQITNQKQVYRSTYRNPKNYEGHQGPVFE